MGGWRQDELELALELGVSPRRLSGWEPKEVTRYEYENGLLVGSVTEREPEFSREDVEAFIAYKESLRVGPHGHPMSEAVSPLGDPSNPNREWDWNVPLPVKDFAQDALDRAKKRYKDQYPDADLGALRWLVEKRDLPARPGG